MKTSTKLSTIFIVSTVIFMAAIPVIMYGFFPMLYEDQTGFYRLLMIFEFLALVIFVPIFFVLKNMKPEDDVDDVMFEEHTKSSKDILYALFVLPPIMVVIAFLFEIKTAGIIIAGICALYLIYRGVSTIRDSYKNKKSSQSSHKASQKWD